MGEAEITDCGGAATGAYWPAAIQLVVVRSHTE
jgi:hypothetical protein